MSSDTLPERNAQTLTTLQSEGLRHHIPPGISKVLMWGGDGGDGRCWLCSLGCYRQPFGILTPNVQAMPDVVTRWGMWLRMLVGES